MTKRWMELLGAGIVVAVALALWLPQLRWGLPSRDADRWLFGGRTPWSGKEILEKLEAPKSGSLAPVLGGEGGGEGVQPRGADVDATPIRDRSKPNLLNTTDAQRAQIVQRFRLMSRQPDEFIQFKALAEMSQRSGLSKLDPRLYQYGGLWIYPVGGLIRAAMVFGWIETPPAGVSAREFYLDRPDTFGKFYVVGRAYSMAWGVVAAIAVMLLARRASGSIVLAVLAAIAYIALPSVQTAAHEAKPHLAGAALCLLAIFAAARFVDAGRRRWLLVAGGLCGAAMGMVVSMALSLAVLPVALFLYSVARNRGRRLGEGEWMGGTQATHEPRASTPLPQPSPPITGAREPSRKTSFVAALLVAVLIYAITNPFVLINAVAAPHLLRSNLGNSTAMYGVRGIGHMIPDAVRIAGHAMTPVGFAIAVALCASLAISRIWRSHVVSSRRDATTICLLAAPATFVAIQFILLAAGKPAEYARFGLVLWAFLCVTAAVAVRRAIASPKRDGLVVAVCVLGFTALAIFLPTRTGYDRWKWLDVDDSAAQLDTMRQLGTSAGVEPWRLGVAYEPAPWSTPPMNLFDQEIVLVRATPAMLDQVDAFVWPINLESQIFEPAEDRESLDWRQNRFGHRAETRDGGPDRWRGGW